MTIIVSASLTSTNPAHGRTFKLEVVNQGLLLALGKTQLLDWPSSRRSIWCIKKFWSFAFHSSHGGGLVLVENWNEVDDGYPVSVEARSHNKQHAGRSCPAESIASPHRHHRRPSSLPASSNPPNTLFLRFLVIYRHHVARSYDDHVSHSSASEARPPR